MFKYRNFVTNVYSYDLSDKEIYYISTDKEVIRYENGIGNNILKLSCLCHILLFQNKLYISDPSDLINTYCIDLKTNKISRNFSEEGVKFFDLYGAYESGKIGLRFKNGNYSVYDIEQDIILSTFPVSFSLVYLFDGNRSFFRSKQSNTLHSYIDSTNLWELDLSVYGRLKRIFGIVDNVLWLWCEDYYFIGVDVSSGSIKKVWEVFDGVYERKSFLYNFPHFDKEEGKVYYLERSTYVEIDLRGLTTKVLWEDKDLKLDIIGPYFTKDMVYFSGAIRPSVFSNIIGVFDRKKMQVVWQDKIQLVSGDSLWTPRFCDDKLYVQDSGYNLHIYEKSDASLS